MHIREGKVHTIFDLPPMLAEKIQVEPIYPGSRKREKRWLPTPSGLWCIERFAILHPMRMIPDCARDKVTRKSASVEGPNDMKAIWPCFAFSLIIRMLIFPASATAQEIEAIPDPDHIAIPEITGGRDAKIVRNGEKYFYFWRAATTYEEAYADLADCYRFVPIAEGNAALLPMFIAWRGTPEDRDATAPAVNNYGLTGLLIGALLGGSGLERAKQLRLQKCLGPRGYQRFPMPKATWKIMNDGFSLESIAVRAKIASGPRPDAEPLDEIKW